MMALAAAFAAFAFARDHLGLDQGHVIEKRANSCEFGLAATKERPPQTNQCQGRENRQKNSDELGHANANKELPWTNQGNVCGNR